MSSTETPTDDDQWQAVDVLLDQLMPRPRSPWSRFLVGLALTLAVVTFGLSWASGLLLPRPFANSSFDSSRLFVLDEPTRTLTVAVHVPNFSQRAVWLTDVTLAADGLRLVDAAVWPEPAAGAGDCRQEGSTRVCTAEAASVGAEPFSAWPDGLAPLPSVLHPGEAFRLYLRLEPTSCDGPRAAPYGQAELTFDFGPRSFPPMANTVSLPGGLIADVGDAVVVDGQGTVAYSAPPPTGSTPTGAGSATDLSGFLAAACRLTGRG